MRLPRSFLAAAGASALAAALVSGGPATAALAGAAPAAAAPPTTYAPVYLQRPTGPFPTGTALVHLRDAHRVDPLDPAGRTRELMVQLWYPALPFGPRAPYAPPKEAAALDAGYAGPGAFDGTTVSRLRAPVLPGRHRVILMSHGLCASRTDTTAINQQFASLGYVVAAIGQTHESPTVEFPGGRVESTTDPEFCAAGADPFSARYQAVLERLLAVRVADARFVLDALARIDAGRVRADASGVRLPRGLAHSLNTRAVGMFGHSFGGGTAAAMAAADRRVVAGVNLDGFVIGPVKDTGLRKPFLVVGSGYHDMEFDPSWASFLPKLTGWHRWFQYVGAGHYRFMDFGGSTHQWGLDTTLRTQNPQAWAESFGDVDDRTSQALTVRVTTAFFQRFLRGIPQRILRHPGAVYPQLVDRTPTI
jgi:dienelactone hydrolase